MTIICYRNGKLAADSRVTANNVVCCEVKKTFKCSGTFKTGETFRLFGGASGCPSISELFKQYYLDNVHTMTTLKLRCEYLNNNPNDNFNGFIAVKTNIIRLYIVNFTGLIIEIFTDFYAIGSGFEIALGAMEMGASAKKAVEIAIKYDGCCGGKVRILKFD